MLTDEDGLLSDDHEDSDTEFTIPFALLSTKEKEERIMYLWRKMIKRSIGAS